MCNFFCTQIRFYIYRGAQPQSSILKIPFKMGFLWRRRSSLVKIVILLSAVWFTIAFLIYSEDGNGTSGGGGSGSGGSGAGGGGQQHDNFQALLLKSGGEFNGNDEIGEADNGNDMNGLESVINNVIMSGNVLQQQTGVGGADGGGVADGGDDGEQFPKVPMLDDNSKYICVCVCVLEINNNFCHK